MGLQIRCVNVVLSEVIVGKAEGGLRLVVHPTGEWSTELYSTVQ